MSDLLVAFDNNAPAGSKFGPEVVAEIQEVAPSVLDDGSVTEPKLADDAVTQPKIAPGAVGPVEIAAGGVTEPNLAAGAVTGPKIANGAVTAAKAGVGVATAQDSSNNDISLRLVPITQVEYDGLGAPDPNTAYLIT